MSEAVPSGKAPSTGLDVRGWSLLFALSANMLLDAVEVSVVLVGLPVIADRLGLSPWAVQWLMSGFALGFVVALVTGPRLCARIGRRRAYLAALLVFGLASLSGGLVDGLVPLVAVRVVKGCCAGLTAPLGLGIIIDTFAEGPQRRRAVSVYSFFGASGFTAGLLLAGLLAGWNWRSVLVLPAPVALLLLLYGLFALPQDLTGSLPRAPRWMLLRHRSLLQSGVGAASLNGTYQGLLLVMTFQAQCAFGWTVWQTALAVLPACVPLMVTTPFSGRLIARYGTRRLITLGALFPFLGYALYLAKPQGTPYVLGMLPAMLLVEAGFCCAFTALNMHATAAVTAADRGAALAVYQTCVQFGVVVLLPLVALPLTHDDLRLALAIVTTVGGLALVVSLTNYLTETSGEGDRQT